MPSNYDAKLTRVLSKYIIDYFTGIRPNYLARIPEWSSEKISKQYLHFIKFVKKTYGISESELVDIYNNVYIVCERDIGQVFENEPFIIDILPLPDFWYTCMKHMAVVVQFPLDRNNVSFTIGLIVQKQIKLECLKMESIHSEPDNVDVDVVIVQPRLDRNRDTPLHYIEDLENVFYEPISKEIKEPQVHDDTRIFRIKK